MARTIPAQPRRLRHWTGRGNELRRSGGLAPDLTCRPHVEAQQRVIFERGRIDRTMNAYVAGSMNAIAEIKRRVADLEARCFTVLSTWHQRDESKETHIEIATKDWLELMRSQLVIVCADTPSSSGGYLTEF